MPADALTGPYAQQQKLLLYVLPVVFAVGGIAFPIGVLLYWTTSNLWTMGQQFYVIRNNPAPNTEAARAKEKRDAEKRTAQGPARGRPGRRRRHQDTGRARDARRRAQQPKKQSRSQRKKGGGGDSPRGGPSKPIDHPEQSRRHPMSEPRNDTMPETAADRGTGRGTETRGRARDRRGARGRRRHRRGGHPPTEPVDEADDVRRPDDRGRRRPEDDDDDETTSDEDGGRGDRPEPSRSASSRRARSRPTTSRSCSRSPTSTATWTWTSRATGPPCRSSAPTCPSSSGDQGEVLEALQELTRLAVYRETGERSRLMLDVSGHRADRRTALEEQAAEIVAQVKESGEQAVPRADVAVRAQGGPRRRRGRRPEVGVRGRRAAPLRRGAARHDHQPT